MVGIRLTFSEIVLLFSKVITIPFYIPPAVYENSSLATSLPIFGMFSLFHSDQSTRCAVAFHLVLIGISLMTNNVEHLFIA